MPTVLITGANRGLGLEFARQYARDGWRVIATSRAPEKAESLHQLGPSVAAHRLDVADFAAVAALARELADETIDLLIANAGIKGPAIAAGKFDAEGQAWLKTFWINSIAPFALAGAFHAHVARSEQRKMVAITSYLGSIGTNDDGGMYGYRSSKAALNAIWRSYAMDHRKIVAVLLNPGWVRTDMGGVRAPLSPQDSVAGMRRVIGRLTPSDSGRLYGYDGRAGSW
jgi:NAD(P)-dependent dehydrogenase (short-subunit alcohol dehydrogenase family)